jgi:hypothetical protein
LSQVIEAVEQGFFSFHRGEALAYRLVSRDISRSSFFLTRRLEFLKLQWMETSSRSFGRVQ